MKLAVIGASRGIGLELVKMALANGLAVKALVRDPAKFNLQHPELTMVKGDALDSMAVEAVVRDQDAVCCCIGVSPTRQPVTVFSEGVKNLLAAMQKTGARHLVCVTGIGAGDSKGHGGFFYDWILNPLLLKTIYQDKDRQEALIRASDVEWIIVRPGFLTNGPATGRYRVITDLTGITAGKISRADVAHFILAQLAAPTCLRQAPLLTY